MRKNKKSIYENLIPKEEIKEYPEVAPTYLHFGYRADMFPRESGDCRWWASQGWNGQFDIISWDEQKRREQTAKELNIPVFDYDEMCWD